MKYLILFLFLFSSVAEATSFSDTKYSKFQVADSQWNVGACMYTTTCQIYSKNPGTAYKIPWTTGQLSWATGDYISFVPNMVNGVQNTTNPWKAIQYNSNGTQKAIMGLGHIINMGTGYFFFVGSDNNTGQLFSTTTGMNNTAGVTWTGTLNPTVAQVDAAAATWSTTPLNAGQTYTSAPSLCCGGSSASFSADNTKIVKLQQFSNRTTSDSQVYIDQIGNSNTVTINQSGTKNNYAKYTGNGSFDNVSITQSSTSSTATNYTDLSVIGNNNNVTVTQQSTGGTKGAFIGVTNNNNTVTLQQKDNGSDYANISLSGGNKTVNVLQQGSAAHMADITLTGDPASLSLSQSGSTQQYYSINFNCATAGGCAAIQVQQGQ